MFKKTKCKRCGKKIEQKYSFCPHCGFQIYSDENNEDFGMLGKNDFMSLGNEIALPAGFNTLFNSLVKNLNKEMNEQFNSTRFPKEDSAKKIKRDGISISISTFGNGQPKIKVTPLGSRNIQKAVAQKDTEKLKKNNFTGEKLKKFASLKKEEPKTNIRRLSNRVIYELEMPDVKSLEDVSIIKLENSIEIKAIGREKAYAKRMPINLPVVDYELSDGRLILELGVKN